MAVASQKSLSKKENTKFLEACGLEAILNGQTTWLRVSACFSFFSDHVLRFWLKMDSWTRVEICDQFAVFIAEPMDSSELVFKTLYVSFGNWTV